MVSIVLSSLLIPDANTHRNFVKEATVCIGFSSLQWSKIKQTDEVCVFRYLFLTYGP